MQLQTTKVFDRIVANTNKRIQILQGGTSSSKTYSILQFLYVLASNSLIPLIISIVSETGPHLRRGAMRDFMAMLGESYDPSSHNKTDWEFRINDSVIEFFSADQPHKSRGARRDILFINECNNIPKITYDELEVRTKRRVFLDFNPVEFFWAHELINQANVSFDVSTYKDNTFLDSRIVQSIESRRLLNPNWWRVYGEGQIGKLEGLLFPGFELVDEMPDIPTMVGLDFGFTNDPTALIELGIKGDYCYWNELIYERYLLNSNICAKMRKLGLPSTQLIYADCAEPKSIAEINAENFYIKPCQKGKDRMHVELDYLLRYKHCVTKSSTNIIKELRGLSWATDKNGHLTNEIAPGIDNHAFDAARYAITDMIKTQAATSVEIAI